MRHKLCLVVDDDPFIRAYITTLLQREEHFETLQADGGSRALEIMKALGDAVDLIISDIQMPGGDGVAFAHAVTALYPDVPIILVSATIRPRDAMEFEFVVKPFTPVELMKVVRGVLAQRPVTVSTLPTMLSGR